VVRVLGLLALGAAFAVATAAFGWLAVPLLAFVLAIGLGVGAAPGGRAPAGSLAVAAAVAWAGLLALASVRGPLWPLAERLALVLRLPAALLTLVTIGFAAALAWSAATVGSAVVSLFPRRAPRPR
jgi:hypothetical protein